MSRLNRILFTAVAILAATVVCEAAPEAPAAVTLRQAAGGRFLVGAAVMSQQLDNPKLAGMIARQFDCITGENEFKPINLEPRPGQYNFEPADKICTFAQQHQMKVVGHNLLWHNQAGAWMFQDENKQPLPREKGLQNLKNHIDAVAGHFKGKVIGWDVVNEAISDTDGEYLRQTPAFKSIGDDYIAKAFEFAHAADPNGKLIYNDYSVENPEKRDKTLRLIRELKARGVPIDEIGIQGHSTVNDPTSPDALDDAIGMYAAAGVKVVITELDVDVLPRLQQGADITATEKSGLDPYPRGLPPEVAKAQADYYARIFRVVLKHPGVVTRVTFWGSHDGTSWLNHWPVRGRTNYPLLFDRNLQPKAAFSAIIDVLTHPTP